MHSSLTASGMLPLYPGAAKASAQDKTPLLRQMHSGISPGWLKIAVRNSQIVVWECERAVSVCRRNQANEPAQWR